MEFSLNISSSLSVFEILSKLETFEKHNSKIIASNSDEDTEFLLELADKMNHSKLKMADYQHYTIWTANNFYYNKKGNLCIMHPR